MDRDRGQTQARLSTPVTGRDHKSGIPMVFLMALMAAGCALLALYVFDESFRIVGWGFAALMGLGAAVGLNEAIKGTPTAKCPQCDTILSGRVATCGRCAIAFELRDNVYTELPDDAAQNFTIVLKKGHELPNLCITCGKPATQLKEVEAISGTRSDLGGTMTRYFSIKVPICEDNGHANKYGTLKPAYGPPGKDAQGYSSVSTEFSFTTRSYRYFKEFCRLNPGVCPLSESDIPVEAFSADLASSLREMGLLAESRVLSKYYLTASLYEIRRPVLGLDMSVTMNVRYIVAPVVGHSIFDEIISSTGKTKAFSGPKGVPIAEEAAARENLAEFMRRLGSRASAASISPFS